jgi:hypothetical protein
MRQHFKFVYRAIALMAATVGTSETSVNVYQSTQRKLPEGSRPYTGRRGNLKI